MRRKLGKQEGERKKFRAVFSHVGKKAGYLGYSEETILLKFIFDIGANQVVADHVWFSFTKGFQEARLAPGESVEFEARVKKYKKGYVNKALGMDNRSYDYKLSHPTNIKKVVSSS